MASPIRTFPQSESEQNLQMLSIPEQAEKISEEK